MTDSDRGPRNPWHIAPYFLVEDVVRTAEFYREKLGFDYDRFWGEPPAFCMVKRRGVIIMLSQIETAGAVRPNPVADPRREAWDAYLWIDDADALRSELAGRGITPIRDLCDQPYGMRDFEVDDCNGYRLCFGHDLEVEPEDS
jgi:uncharacterized glyoxalase superfamily protein PhnB